MRLSGRRSLSGSTRSTVFTNNTFPKITFESLCVVAKIAQMQLVIPPPSKISHLPNLFQEGIVFCMAEMARRINFASSSSPPPKAPNFRGGLPDFLRLHAKGHRAVKDVVFDPEATCSTSFEGLGSSENAAKKQAARAVMSLRLVPPYLRRGERDDRVGEGPLHRTMVDALLSSMSRRFVLFYQRSAACKRSINDMSWVAQTIPVDPEEK